MDNYTRLSEEFQKEIAHQDERKEALDQVVRDLAMEQEKINAQNKTNSLIASDLARNQKELGNTQTELKHREEQIIIKEKIIHATTQTLAHEREALILKQAEITKREKDLVENENKMKEIKADLERNLAVVNAELAFDDTRKAKIKHKEAEIENQLQRVRNINI